MEFMEGKAYKETLGENIKEVELLPHIKEVHDKIVDVCKFFFEGNYNGDAPFKGFILKGPPGTGKTEVIKQVAKTLARRLKGLNYNVILAFVDGASIAAPKWGDAEKNIRSVFQRAKESSGIQPKVIILFDDIESLMLSRGTELAKEWHYSINSVLFHEIDNLDPFNAIICATTNRPDLVDEALESRLYPINFPSMPTNYLMVIVDNILDKYKCEKTKREEVRNFVRKKLKEKHKATIRDAQQLTIFECIERGVWE